MRNRDFGFNCDTCGNQTANISDFTVVHELETDSYAYRVRCGIGCGRILLKSLTERSYELMKASGVKTEEFDARVARDSAAIPNILDPLTDAAIDDFAIELNLGEISLDGLG